MSDDDLVQSASSWGPGLIGFAISIAMYGTAVGQSIFYARSFPKDPISTKLIVFLLFIADTTQLPRGAWLAVPYLITFTVQILYCQRIWIISGKKQRVTMPIQSCSSALARGVLLRRSVRHNTIKYLFSTPLTAYAAFTSTVCDMFITSAVFKYLWRSQRDVRMRSRPTLIQELATVIINMGTLTCLMSLTMGIVYLVQESEDEHYWVAAPAVVLSRCYINSFLAVLNARRSIRDRERHLYIIELPTLTTLS
ncbi:hypothetical protein HYDPIDRAFT_30873 [Hydnomerulius pinastri MD-312]|uniref:DUF6534 domain-containing protein n=1 Tax=Hydnomerulius pinastri MD-312 TaxID=994086 RepID=A0A0C9V8N4_9AGAM|nr:hypothetical protein HYDPIDRAFT_30873 [Hydnomerulius pinastri MD-312]